MRIIGLTGPTGAGKGEVGRRFAKAGALVIDTDRLAREVVTPPSAVLGELAAVFGRDILREDGTLDRALLAERAFASKEAQETLNAITHPAIIRRTRELIEASDRETAVIDAPLLFESGMDRMCHTTVAVLAPEAVRLARIKARDGITEERARERMCAQPDEAFYRERATHTLVNDGTLSSLQAAADALIRRIGEGQL